MPELEAATSLRSSKSIRTLLAPAPQTILEASEAVAGPLKGALGCLAQILRAMDPSDWPASGRAFGMLARHMLDQRPKVRKRAAGGMVEVMASIQHTPAAPHAAETLLTLCRQILAGPEAAARAAAEASKKRRDEVESAITRAVSDALHLLGALKQVLPLLSETAVISACQLIFRLFPLGQPLLNRHSTDVLASLLGSGSCPLGAKPLGDLVSFVLDQRDLWDRRDADSVISMTRVVESGIQRLREVDAKACAARLPKAVHALVPQLAAEQDGVRFATSETLRNLLTSCISDGMLSEALASRGGKPTPLESIISAVVGALGPRYQDGWALALPVAAALVERLGLEGGALADSLVERIGDFLAGAFDASEEDAQSFVACASAAESALGVCFRSLGPAAVLSVLPLNLDKGLDGTGEARTWMLPLLKEHVREASLEYWGRSMLPLARR